MQQIRSSEVPMTFIVFLVIHINFWKIQENFFRQVSSFN